MRASKPYEIPITADKERKKILVDYKLKEQKLNSFYEEKKYLASGKTVFDRIFNAPNKSIVEMIKGVSNESLPHDWKSDVKAEEFTHFILLIYLPHNSDRVQVNDVAMRLAPIVKYCDNYLSSIAVFDSFHKSYLFFDRKSIEVLKNKGKFNASTIKRIEGQGLSFSRFNSRTIECQKQDNHLFVPVEVIGPNGVKTPYMLFDTGASITVVSENIINSTGYDNLNNAPKRTFSTANGNMTTQVVNREINISGFRRKIEVAVGKADNVNLLGMNYFHGLKYVVDFTNSNIYVWEE